MAVDTVFGRSGDVVADSLDYSAFYAPINMPQLPAAGLTGQVLTKKTDTSFDTEWRDTADLDVSVEKVSNKVTVFSGPTDVQYPSALLVQTSLNGKLDKLTAITPGTKTKISYNASGLVTVGVDATTVDIADSTDKRYVTDTQLVKLANTTGINTGDQDLSAYALQSSLDTTNSQVAALGNTFTDYALQADLDVTNANVNANTANFANFALATDLAATNTNLNALLTALPTNYASLTVFNPVKTDHERFRSDIMDPTYVASTAAEVKLTFMGGLTRDPVTNIVSSDMVMNPAPPYSFWGNSTGFTGPPAYVQVAAECLTNGVTGTGHVVLDTGPIISSPMFNGVTLASLADSGVSTAPTVFVVDHDFTGGGSIVPGFGATLAFTGRSSTTSGRAMGAMRALWTNAVDGSRTSNIVLSPVLNALAVDSLWLHGDGSMALGTNSGSGKGVLWVSSGYQAPGVGVVGQVLRDDGTKFVPAQLQFSDLAGQFGSAPAVKTTTTDQTNAAEATHFSVAIPAGSVVGTAWRVLAWGNADNGASAITFLGSLRWGGLTGVQLVTTQPFVSTTTISTNRTWRAEFLVVITGVGVSGAARASCTTFEHTTQVATNIPTVWELNSGATDVAGVNTTIATTLVLTWVMSATTGAPHIRTFGAIAELVRR